MTKKEPRVIFLFDESEPTKEETEQWAAEFVALLLKWDMRSKDKEK